MAPRHIAPTRAVLYTRVSTGKQAASGLGLEAQIAACRALAVARGLEILAEHSDAAVSGKDGLAYRPGLAAVVEAAGGRPDVVVVVYSVSRLARRQRLLWELLDDRGDYKLQVVSATEGFDATTAAGRAMLGMIATFAALEADMVSERTSAALAARRARGLPLGAPRLAERSPATAALVRQLHASGMSYEQVAAELTKRGVPTARGGAAKWHATTVRRTLLQEVRA